MGLLDLDGQVGGFVDIEVNSSCIIKQQFNSFHCCSKFFAEEEMSFVVQAFFTEGAVANAAGHCSAGVVGQVVVSVTLLAHLEGAAAHTKGYGAAHAGVIVELVVADAGLTLVLGRAASAVLNVALDA